MEMNTFDTFINVLLNGPVNVIQENKSEWKDPLNRHHMKGTRGINRKKMGFVPKAHQTDLPLSSGDKVLNIAKEAKQGIWEINLAQAVPIARKYKFHLPSANRPIKHLGSTKIVMYLRWDNYEKRYRIYLVKHGKFTRGGITAKKEQRAPKPFKGSFKSKYKAKKPQRPKKPMYDKGKVLNTVHYKTF